MWWARQDANLQPDRYEREEVEAGREARGPGAFDRRTVANRYLEL